jgi:hypothetical protein
MFSEYGVLRFEPDPVWLPSNAYSEVKVCCGLVTTNAVVASYSRVTSKNTGFMSPIHMSVSQNV